MFNKSKTLYLVITILSVLLIVGCRAENKTEKYNKLFSLGEGMDYRSFVFEVNKPTRTPYPVKINELYGYTVNKQSSHVEDVTEAIFQAAKPFTEQLGAVKFNGKWGFIKLIEDYRAFEFVIPNIYEGAEPFSEELAAVKINGLYGYIDKNNNMIIEPSFLSAHYFSGGLAVVAKEDGWFFINKDGNVKIKGPFEGAESFSMFIGDRKISLAPVKINGKWGYIDTLGNIIIKPLYDDAWSFDASGSAAVLINGKWKLINTYGKIIN